MMAVGEDTQPFEPVKPRRSYGCLRFVVIVLLAVVWVVGSYSGGRESVAPDTHLSDLDKSATAQAVGESVSTVFLGVEGVKNFGTTSARPDDFYAVVLVEEGYVNFDTAERLRSIVSSMTGNTKFMTFILDDGETAIAFVWDGDRGEFQEIVQNPERP